MSSSRFNPFLKLAFPCFLTQKFVWSRRLIVSFSHCIMIISAMLKIFPYFRGKFRFVPTARKTMSIESRRLGEGWWWTYVARMDRGVRVHSLDVILQRLGRAVWSAAGLLYHGRRLVSIMAKSMLLWWLLGSEGGRRIGGSRGGTACG